MPEILEKTTEKFSKNELIAIVEKVLMGMPVNVDKQQQNEAYSGWRLVNKDGRVIGLLSIEPSMGRPGNWKITTNYGSQNDPIDTMEIDMLLNTIRREIYAQNYEYIFSGKLRKDLKAGNDPAEKQEKTGDRYNSHNEGGDVPLKTGPKPKNRSAKAQARGDWENRTGRVAELSFDDWSEEKWGCGSDGVLKVPYQTFYSWCPACGKTKCEEHKNS